MLIVPLLLFPVHVTEAPPTLGTEFLTGFDLLAAASVLLSPESASAPAFGAAEAGFEPGVDSAGGETRHSLVTCSIWDGKQHR